MYFSLSLHTAEKELGYPLTFMAEKIAEVVTYPAEVCKKKKIAPNFLSCWCAKSILQKLSSTHGLVCSPSEIVLTMHGFFGSRGKGRGFTQLSQPGSCWVPPTTYWHGLVLHLARVQDAAGEFSATYSGV